MSLSQSHARGLGSTETKTIPARVSSTRLFLETASLLAASPLHRRPRLQITGFFPLSSNRFVLHGVLHGGNVRVRIGGYWGLRTMR